MSTMQIDSARIETTVRPLNLSRMNQRHTVTPHTSPSDAPRLPVHRAPNPSSAHTDNATAGPGTRRPAARSPISQATKANADRFRNAAKLLMSRNSAVPRSPDSILAITDETAPPHAVTTMTAIATRHAPEAAAIRRPNM